MKIYKPLVDTSYWCIFGVCLSAVAVLIAVSVPEPLTFIITAPTALFVIYFLISPLFGYVELREDTLFIKYGFVMKREIPYAKIRGVARGHGIYSESMLSLKTALDHINIKYNSFDITCVSVVNLDDLALEITERAAHSGQ